MKGIFTIFDHKKWVFSYIVLFLAFFKLESEHTVVIVAALIPCVIGASSFEKSQWRKHGIDDNV